jgi:hypothetical protein
MREQLRLGHHGGGTKAHPGPAKAQPVYYRNIIENPLSLTLLGETFVAFGDRAFCAVFFTHNL